MVAPEFAAVDLGLAGSSHCARLRRRLASSRATLSQPCGRPATSVRPPSSYWQRRQKIVSEASASPSSLTRSIRSPAPKALARRAATRPAGRASGAGHAAGGRYLLRLVTWQPAAGIGTPTILDALAQVYTGNRKDRPVLERAYNVCSDLGLVGATLASGGLAAVQELRVRPGNPVRVMLAQRLSDARDCRQAGRAVHGGVQVRRHAGAGTPYC